MKKKILVIDDAEIVLHTIKFLLEDMDYEVATFRDPIEGEEEAKNNHYDLILLDLRMPKRNGAEITQNILEVRPDALILILTAYTTEPLAKKALEVGARSLINKPFEIAKILDFLK